MKKYLFLFVAAVLSFASAFAQEKTNVARECVLFEIFTGVRCPYCPAAANGIAQLLEEGKAIAPVAYHTNAFSTAEYYTAETNARASYYNIDGYPTLKADGLLTYANGGDASQTNYPQYLSRYNQRISQASPFTIDLSYEPAEGNLCRVNCTVNKVGDCAGNDVRVFIALTQCNIDVSWQGMQGLHHVCRDMIPTQLGTPFTGTSMTISETFEMKYPKEDCYLTAWVQNYSGTKEVYQAVRLSMVLDLDYDLVMKSVSQMITQNCSGYINPIVTVKYCGNETVTTFDVVASVEGQEVNRYSWNGSLNKDESVDVSLPEFNFGQAENLIFSAVMPNGHEDDFPADNSISVALEEVPVVNGYLKIQVKSGKNNENESMVITDMETLEVFKVITFELPSHVYTTEVILPNSSCYRITAIDTEGEGWGTGFFQVTDADNHVVMQCGGSDNKFTYEMSVEVDCDGELNVGETAEKEFMVYPNPNNGVFSMDLCEGQWQVTVYDVAGRLVYESAQFTEGQIDLRQYGNGVYFVKAKNGSDELVKKVVVL